jgi:Kef-type K+ transport system membrane component KefB
MTDHVLVSVLVVLAGSIVLGEIAATLRQPRIVGAMVWGISLATFCHAIPVPALTALQDHHGVIKQLGSLGLILILAGVGHDLRCAKGEPGAGAGFAQLMDVLGPFAIAALIVWPVIPALTGERPPATLLFVF